MNQLFIHLPVWHLCLDECLTSISNFTYFILISWSSSQPALSLPHVSVGQLSLSTLSGAKTWRCNKSYIAHFTLPASSYTQSPPANLLHPSLKQMNKEIDCAPWYLGLKHGVWSGRLRNFNLDNNHQHRYGTNHVLGTVLNTSHV